MKFVDETNKNKKVNQAASPTKWITAYTIHHQPWFKIPYTVTIIDTPGFGHTDGFEKDIQLMQQIREFFSLDDFGETHLDVVGFVAKASDARLCTEVHI